MRSPLGSLLVWRNAARRNGNSGRVLSGTNRVCPSRPLLCPIESLCTATLCFGTGLHLALCATTRSQFLRGSIGIGGVCLWWISAVSVLKSALSMFDGLDASGVVFREPHVGR